MTANLRANPLALTWVPLDRIRANTYQVRRTEDPTHVRNLAANIRSLKTQLPETLGLQQPPTARLVETDGTPANPTLYNNLAGLTPDSLAKLNLYAELHFGHSRAAGFLLLTQGAPADPNDPESTALAADPDYAFMPLFLRPADAATMWKAAVGENTIRQDITAIEAALAVARAVEEIGISQAEAGAAMGLSPSATAARLRLLKLPEPIQAALLDRYMPEGVARALLPLLATPHFLARLDVEQLCLATAHDIETYVAKLIINCPPLPLGDEVPYRAWDYSARRIAAKPEPRDQKFDYDWKPADAERALGPCTGCKFNVAFAGDGGPRCTQTGDAAAPCYDEKTRNWRIEQRAEQVAAATAKREAQVAAAQATRAVLSVPEQAGPPPATVTPNGTHPTPPQPQPPTIRNLAEIANGAPLAAGDRIVGEIEGQPVSLAVMALLPPGHKLNEYGEPAVLIADADQKGTVNEDAQAIMPASAFEQMLDRTFTLPDEITAPAPTPPTPAAAAAAAAAALETTTATPQPAAPLPPREMVFKSKKLQVLDAVDEFRVQWFGEYDTPAALIDHGLCTPDRCECMGLAYNPHAHERHLRPDPQGAPNMCLVCTSRNRMANRTREMTHGNLKAFRAAVRANREHAKTMLKAAWLEIDPRDLHTHPLYLRQMLRLDTRDHLFAAPDELPFTLFCALAAQHCKDATDVTIDKEQRHWNLDTLKNWIAAVTGEPPSYPKPNGWDDLDETAVAAYHAAGCDPKLVTRPRALRWLAQFRDGWKHEDMLRTAEKIENPPPTHEQPTARPRPAANPEEEKPAEEEEPREEEPLIRLYVGDEVECDDGYYTVTAITAGATPDGDTLILNPWQDDDEEPEPDENDNPISWSIILGHEDAAEYGWAFDPAQPNRPAEPEEEHHTRLYIGDEVNCSDLTYTVTAVTAGATPADDTITLVAHTDAAADAEWILTLDREEAAELCWAFDPTQPNRPAEPEEEEEPTAKPTA